VYKRQVLIALYSACISKNLIHGFSGDYYAQINYIAAERYSYGDVPKPNVIIGSSMAWAIGLYGADDLFYNLSLVGDGPRTGLEIISRSQNKPRVVAIEVSPTILKDIDEKNLGRLFMPGLSEIRRAVPAFQEQYEPSLILYNNSKPLLNVVSQIGVKTANIIKPYLESSALSSRKKNENKNSDFKTLLNMEKEFWDKSVPDVMTENNISDFGTRVDELRSEGVKIVFFEVPVDPVIASSLQFRTTRKAFLQRFPKNRYLWLPSPDSRLYKQDDGVHLDGKSAKKYTYWFAENMAELVIKEHKAAR
jgi:hypothetical protein